MKNAGKIRLAALLCFFLILGLLVVNGGQAGAGLWEKTLNIDPTKPVNLSFKDVNGDLVVTASTEKTVEIKTRKEPLSKDQKLAKRLVEATKIEVNQKGNTIDITVVYPRLRAIFFGLRDYRRIKVSTEIAVPPLANLTIRLVDGGASLKGRFQEVNLTTIDGSAWLENIEGKLFLKTVDGRITVNQGKGMVEANSVDGDILVEGEFEPLRIETTDGDISVKLEPGTSITRPWHLRTVDGDIELFIPEDLSADVLLETSDGSASCDIPLTSTEVQGRRKLSGRINQGGPLISLRTVDGLIRVKPARPTKRAAS